MQAALAGHLLDVPTVIPIHYGGFESDPYYHQVPQALDRFTEEAARYPYEVLHLNPGQSAEVAGTGRFCR